MACCIVVTVKAIFIVLEGYKKAHGMRVLRLRVHKLVRSVVLSDSDEAVPAQ